MPDWANHAPAPNRTMAVPFKIRTATCSALAPRLYHLPGENGMLLRRCVSCGRLQHSMGACLNTRCRIIAYRTMRLVLLSMSRLCRCALPGMVWHCMLLLTETCIVRVTLILFVLRRSLKSSRLNRQRMRVEKRYTCNGNLPL